MVVIHDIYDIFRTGYHRPDIDWFPIPTWGTFRWKEQSVRLAYRCGRTDVCIAEAQAPDGYIYTLPAFRKASGLSMYPDNQASFFQLNPDNQAVPHLKV